MKLHNTYRTLLDQIKQTYAQGQAAAVKAARRQLVLTYWENGKY